MKGRPWPLSKQHSPSKAFKMGTQGLAFFNLLSSLSSGLRSRPFRFEFATKRPFGRRPFNFPTPTEIAARAQGNPEDPIYGLG
jgi:hypothetical protein